MNELSVAAAIAGAPAARTDGPEAFAPPGQRAYQNIRGFGHDFAQYMEHSGDAAIAEAERHLAEAKLYRDDCYMFAQQARDAAENEARRAVRYTNRISRLANKLEEARLEHDSDIPPMDPPNVKFEGSLSGTLVNPGQPAVEVPEPKAAVPAQPQETPA